MGSLLTVWQGWEFRLSTWLLLVWVGTGSQFCFLWYLARVEQLFYQFLVLLSCLFPAALAGEISLYFVFFGLCLLMFPAVGLHSCKLGYVRHKGSTGLHHCVILQVLTHLVGLPSPLYLSEPSLLVLSIKNLVVLTGKNMEKSINFCLPQSGSWISF